MVFPRFFHFFLGNMAFAGTSMLLGWCFYVASEAAFWTSVEAMGLSCKLWNVESHGDPSVLLWKRGADKDFHGPPWCFCLDMSAFMMIS